LERENLMQDLKDGKVKPYDERFEDWVFPEEWKDFTRADKIVMDLKFAEEVELEHESVNTLKDE
jgi:hypothetical protein